MPRKILELPKKPMQRKWSKENMELAVAEIYEEKKTVYGAAKYYEIPKATLQRFVKSNNGKEVLKIPKIGRPTILEEKFANELVKYLVEME